MSLIDGSERYYAKRRAGLSDIRRDGSRTNPKTDRQADAAEQYVCGIFHKPYNNEIYDNHGDGGSDFKLGDYTVEVVHLGMIDGYSKPRLDGNLIINPHEPWRWANIYILVRGSIETNFEILGWCTHSELISHPTRDFGYGNRFWCPINDLKPIEPLLLACGICETKSNS